MRKIVIIQDYLRNGGTERQSVLLAHAFAAANHEVTLLTFRPGGVLDTGIAVRGVSRVVLQPFDLGLDWFAPGLKSEIARISPDIILCMGRMANSRAGDLVRAFPKIAVLATMRTGKQLPARYSRSLKEVRHVVANSHEAARVLQDVYQVPADNISVIHNALVFERGSLGDAKPREWAQGQPLVMLCGAMFRREKNQRELLEIVARLPKEISWKLVFVGDGPERKSCESLAANLGIADRVIFHGFQQDPRPFYQEADIAVLTSQSESLPNFLVEAHAHGIPSVAYSVGGVSECGGITVTAGDSNAFLRELTTLLSDSEKRHEESRKIRQYAQEHFSPDAQTRLYLDLFDRFCS